MLPNRHDDNNLIGNGGDLLRKSYPEEVRALVTAYSHIVGDRFSIEGMPVDDNFRSKKKKKMDLLKCDGDYPLIPLESEWPESAEGLQMFVRSYLTWHFRK